MKKMKYSFLLVASLCIAGLCHAQDVKVRGEKEYKIPIANTKDGKLVLDGFPENLSIEGYAGGDIIVSSGNEDNDGGGDRAKGLKPVYASGTDNTGVGVSMEKDGNRITLRCLLPITHSARYRIRVPESLAIGITRDCAGGGETMISNMKNEIEFKGCHDVTLKNVTGPLVISTISGEVNVVFTDISKDKPISIASVSGEVDVTLPAKAGFNLEMGTVSGNMYSDFDIQAAKQGDMERVGGSNIKAKINGGGIDVRLHSVSGNVYLRKG
jgi:hypothetical protein